MKWMKNLLVIDGTNLLKGFYDKGDSFKQKQDHIITDIKNSRYAKDYEIVLVFDSKMQSFTYSEQIRGIEVIYSGYKKEADEVIGALIHKKTGYDKKVVVSSDGLIQNIIFGYANTYRKSSREFFSEIKGR
jgi:uncharacterized protein